MRRLLAILVPCLLLLLTACSSSAPEITSQPAGDVSKLESLKLSDNGEKKAPGVDFAKPLEVSEPTVKVITEGTGERVKANQVAEISYMAVDGKEGKTLEDTFSGQTQPVELNDELKQGSPVIYNAFVGAKLGSSLALAIPGSPAQGGGEAGATQLIIIKIVSANDAPQVLDQPEGEEVTPPAGLPAVKVNDAGIPEISVDGVAAPKELIAQDLIKGTGPVVKESDALTVNYVGVTLAGGTKFDSSFDRGEKATFALNGVIKGWTQGLAGKTVGSRVLLVIPKDLAYGDAGQGEAKGDLVFVVDILGVHPA